LGLFHNSTIASVYAPGVLNEISPGGAFLQNNHAKDINVCPQGCKDRWCIYMHVHMQLHMHIFCGKCFWSWCLLDWVVVLRMM